MVFYQLCRLCLAQESPLWKGLMDAPAIDSTQQLRPITVIVPSFNRAHLLTRTLPSYLQDEVEELILVDDASSDDTAHVIRDLQTHDQRIQYLRNEVNLKQTGSKNRAMKNVRTRYVYFGDDDSILAPQALATLLRTLEQTNADVIGCRALYMKEHETVDDCEARHKKIAHNVDAIVDLRMLHFNFTQCVVRPVRVPVCQASCLVKTEIALKFPFDINYRGNAYREETDFLLRISAAGHTIFYDSSVTQINLPPSMATGGARTNSQVRREFYHIVNTWKFVRKNRVSLKSLAPGRSSLGFILVYVLDRVFAAIKKVSTT